MGYAWYVRTGDGVYGPITAKELKQRGQEGRIPAGAFVRRGEDGTWIPAGKVRGLTIGPEEASKPPVAAPPPDASPVEPALVAQAPWSVSTEPSPVTERLPRRGNGTLIAVCLGSLVVAGLIVAIVVVLVRRQGHAPEDTLAARSSSSSVEGPSEATTTPALSEHRPPYPFTSANEPSETATTSTQSERKPPDSAISVDEPNRAATPPAQSERKPRYRIISTEDLASEEELRYQEWIKVPVKRATSNFASRGSAEVEAHTRRFDHPTFSIGIPEGWKEVPDSDTTLFAKAPEDDLALQVALLTNFTGRSPREILGLNMMQYQHHWTLHEAVNGQLGENAALRCMISQTVPGQQYELLKYWVVLQDSPICAWVVTFRAKPSTLRPNLPLFEAMFATFEPKMHVSGQPVEDWELEKPGDPSDWESISVVRLYDGQIRGYQLTTGYRGFLVMLPETEQERAAIDPAGKSIDQWLDMLAGDDFLDRGEAVVALGKIGAPAVDRLIKMLDPNDLGLCTRAATTLKEMGPEVPEAGRACAQLAAHGNPHLCRLGIQALKDFGSAGVEAIAASLDRPEARLRSLAAATLGELGPSAASAAPALAEALCRQQSEEIMAARALAVIGPAGKAAIPIVARLLDNEEAKVRERAIKVLMRLGPDAVPVLSQKLDHPDQETVTLIIDALASFGPAAESAVPALRRVARRFPGVKRDVTDALEEIGAADP